MLSLSAAIVLFRSLFHLVTTTEMRSCVLPWLTSAHSQWKPIVDLLKISFASDSFDVSSTVFQLLTGYNSRLLCSFGRLWHWWAFNSSWRVKLVGGRSGLPCKTSWLYPAFKITWACRVSWVAALWYWNALPPFVCDINAACDYVVFSRLLQTQLSRLWLKLGQNRLFDGPCWEALSDTICDVTHDKVPKWAF